MTRADLTPEEFAGYAALVASSTLLQRAIEQNLRDQAEITQVQFEILMQLAERPAGLRMAELAQRLIVSRSGLTYQVGQLEKAGMLVRERHDEDERGVIARLTSAGEELRARVLPGHRDLVRSALFDRLSPDDLATITRALGGVADGLRSEGRDSRDLSS